MSCGPEQFGRIPAALITSGRLAESGADRTELLILVGIAAHINGETGKCWPSMETLAKCAGVQPRTARRAVRRLEGRGIINIDPGGGRWKTNTYSIKPVALDDPVTADIPGRPERPSIESNTRSPEAQYPVVCDPLPGRLDPITRSPRTTAKQKNRGTEQQKQSAAGFDSELIRALTAAGVGEPKRSELARLPGLDMRTVQRKAAWCRDQGKGVGILIRELEAASEQAVVRGSRQSASQPKKPEADKPVKSWAEWMDDPGGEPVKLGTTER